MLMPKKGECDFRRGSCSFTRIRDTTCSPVRLFYGEECGPEARSEGRPQRRSNDSPTRSKEGDPPSPRAPLDTFPQIPSCFRHAAAVGARVLPGQAPRTRQCRCRCEHDRPAPCCDPCLAPGCFLLADNACADEEMGAFHLWPRVRVLHLHQQRKLLARVGRVRPARGSAATEDGRRNDGGGIAEAGARPRPAVGDLGRQVLEVQLDVRGVLAGGWRAGDCDDG